MFVFGQIVDTTIRLNTLNRYSVQPDFYMCMMLRIEVQVYYE